MLILNDKTIENLVASTFEKVPIMLWGNIKKELSKDIAIELIEKLEKQKEPKKRESIDRINEETEIFLNTNNVLVRGA